MSLLSANYSGRDRGGDMSVLVCRVEVHPT
jgi:hypothetical protein